MQIRLHDGTRVVQTFNHTQTVGDIRAFLNGEKNSDHCASLANKAAHLTNTLCATVILSVAGGDGRYHLLARDHLSTQGFGGRWRHAAGRGSHQRRDCAELVLSLLSSRCMCSMNRCMQLTHVAFSQREPGAASRQDSTSNSPSRIEGSNITTLQHLSHLSSSRNSCIANMGVQALHTQAQALGSSYVRGSSYLYASSCCLVCCACSY